MIHKLRLRKHAAPAGRGLVVRRRFRWLAKQRLLRIDATLANVGASSEAVGATALVDWAMKVVEDPNGPVYRELTYRRDNWYGSTYWTGPDWTRVGKDWQHPGTKTPSVRRFTAPRDGRVAISGRVYKADLNGDGIRASIAFGGRTVWTADLDGRDANGVEPAVTLAVRRGDAIRFIVHKRGRIFYDTTRWDPAVTYPDGAVHRASKGFSTKAQGEGGWSYEMLLGPSADRQAPHIRAVRTDFAMIDKAVAADKWVDVSGSDALPLLMLSDPADRTGVALAMAPAGPWRLTARLTADGHLRTIVTSGLGSGPTVLKPGQSVRLPPTVVAAYRGGKHAGVAALGRILEADEAVAGFEKLKRRLEEAGSTELALLTMVQAEWRREDGIVETPASYATAAAKHLRRARLLLNDLRRGRRDDFLAAEARELAALTAEAQAGRNRPADLRRLYSRVRRLKRRIALANPLLGGAELLFCKRVPTSYSHLVMQYFGWRARPGGGLFILERPGRSLKCRDITGGKLEAGSVLEPRLSYDARRVVFSYVECGREPLSYAAVRNGQAEGRYHIWEVGVDGTGLRRLTDGPYDDLMPAYLPDGGIVFSSTRRRAYARCFGPQFSRRWHAYTLHRMDGDGGRLRILSLHDTNEWFPTVARDGRIVYARWDYIDRDAVTHQNLWSTRPDGTNPATLWGNATASPHCSFQAKPIPGTDKFVFTASAHHSITAGSIVVVDPAVDCDGHHALTRITPEVPFPEAESRNIREYYSAPWPLSGTYFLVAYSPEPLAWEPRANPPNALGIYLLDAFGNRELLYRDPEISSTNPTPLVPRPAPPALPSALPRLAPATGEMILTDVYQGLGAVRRGSIKALRVIQVFPKSTPRANDPPMGVAGEENGRAILGTVPVEPDGSARFVAPAGAPLLFQALDGNGFAYQTMRSVTYVQAGECIGCVGCHEPRTTAPPAGRPAALARPASRITPGPRDGRPFSYVQTVQPVLDRHCVRCHGGEKTEAKLDLTGAPAGRWTRSYAALTRDRKLVPRFAARNRIQVTPVGGVIGARGSGLVKLLRKGHEKVRLSGGDMRRLAEWIDCNAIFFGSPDPAHHAKQLRGEPVAMPAIQ